MTNTLEEAQDIIFGARNASYGHPRDNFQNIADLWSAYLGVPITPMDHANMMVLLKVARLKSGVYHRDSVVDIAGYAGTIERLQETPTDAVSYSATDIVPDTGAYVVDGRTYYARWEDVPVDQPVNSSDESDNISPWYGDGTLGDLGEPPWRDWIHPDVGPIVWYHLRDLPSGTVVTDKDGEKWKRFSRGVKLYDQYAERWGDMLSLRSADSHDMFGPFEEIK
jgi:hypothetical protein